jgi:sugar lactone lactonase YvrE
MTRRSILLIATMIVAACARQETQTTDTTASQAPPPATTSSAPAHPTELTEGVQTPESVFYDADQDVYLVSNINGQPLDADNNGYILKVTPDTLKGEKWIEAGKNNVTLNAPKGLAVLGDTLYVSDITTVRKFDRNTGAPKGEVKIPGSTFLNDLVSDGKSVYVSDSGMKAGAGGNFEGTGTDAIWQITGDKAKKIASGKDLGRPNGVEMADGKLWAVTFATNELYQVDNGKKTNAAKLPKGSLDGLVHLSDGTFLASSWESNSIFRGPAAGPFQEVITNVKSPADIGYDTKRKLVLVPHFTENKVTVHPLQ